MESTETAGAAVSLAFDRHSGEERQKLCLVIMVCFPQVHTVGVKHLEPSEVQETLSRGVPWTSWLCGSSEPHHGSSGISSNTQLPVVLGNIERILPLPGDIVFKCSFEKRGTHLQF